MSKTYTITPGSQYDRGGACLEYESLCSQWSSDGKRLSGHLLPDTPEVEAALARVLETRQAETVIIPGPARPAPDYDLDNIPGLCPRCETVCYGDCDS